MPASGWADDLVRAAIAKGEAALEDDARRPEPVAVRAHVGARLARALASADERDLVTLIAEAGRSELDYLIFIGALLSLAAARPTCRRSFLEKVRRLAQGDAPGPVDPAERGPFFVLLGDLERLVDVPPAFLRRAVRSYATEGTTSIDYLGSRRNWESVPRRECDLTAGEALAAARALLADERFVAGSVRSALRAPSSRALPPVDSKQLIAIQAGEVEDVYAVLATLGDEARTVVPFALLVARGPGESAAVAREFKLLRAAERSDAQAVRVLRTARVAAKKGQICAYSSEFLDDFGEMNFCYFLSKESSDLDRTGFVLASLLPTRDYEIGTASYAGVLASVVRAVVRAYDPVSETRVEGLSLTRGDVNFHEPALRFTDRRTAELDPARLPRTKLVAWRATREGEGAAAFVEYLFRREYLRDPEGVMPDVEARDADLFVRGVLSGLLIGLIEKRGSVERGVALAQEWLAAYLAAAARGDVRVDPLFPDRVVRRFAKALLRSDR